MTLGAASVVGWWRYPVDVGMDNRARRCGVCESMLRYHFSVGDVSCQLE